MTIHTFDTAGEKGDVISGSIVTDETVGTFGMWELEILETIGSAFHVVGAGRLEVDSVDGEMDFGLKWFAIFEEFDSSSKVLMNLK